MQFQPELREPLTKIDKEPLRVILILEASSEVVGETHDDYITARMATSPPLGPQVEDVVEEGYSAGSVEM